MEDKAALAYKSWLDNLSEPAPEGVWNSIADELDIDQAWAGISEELDLDYVWRNVEMELPTETVLPGSVTSTAKFHKYFWIAAAIILLTLTTPISESPKQNPGAQSAASKENSGSTGKQTISPKDETYASSLKPKIEKKIAVAMDSLIDTNNSDRKKIDTEITELKEEAEISRHVLYNSLITSQPASESLTKMSIKALQPKYKHVFNPVDSVERSDLRQRSALIVNTPESDSLYETGRNVKWRFGIIGSIKNTWLINDETANGLKRSSLNHTKVTYGKEFGVTLQRSIGKRSFLQAEYYLNSEIGQDYQNYIDALYQSKNIRLQYQKLQIAYSRKILERGFMFSPHILGGFYASKLKIADVTIGGENGNVTKEYTPWDYGVLLGIETEFKLNDKLVIVPGIRTSYGFRNIFEGTSQITSYFNKTNTATIGFSVAVKYQY